MRFELVTLHGVKFDQEVYEVILPTANGHIAVFKQHTPLVSAIVPGVITVVRTATDSFDDHEHFAAEVGLVEITGQSVRVLVDEATHASEIIEEEANYALQRALELKQQATDVLSLEHAQALIDRHSVRLKVAELRRRRRTK